MKPEEDFLILPQDASEVRARLIALRDYLITPDAYGKTVLTHNARFWVDAIEAVLNGQGRGV